MKTYPALCVLAGLIAIRAVAADPAGFSLPRSLPEAQGVSSERLVEFVQALEQKVDAVHSFMLVRHGHVVAEGWWAPYAAHEPHMMFSLSKSFTATAIGLAVAEKRLSIDDPVLSFFPDEAPAEPSANLRAMRVRDLLIMSTGHHQEDIRAFPFESSESLVRKFLSLPVTHKPGTHFVYNTPGSFMLSAIVQKVTGQTAAEYSRARLFAPLGIAQPEWDASRQGISYGGFGLNLRTEDIAKFGQLYLQKGQWQGRAILSEAWVERATSRQTANGSSPESDWEQGYGFQFWRCRHGFYRGDGAHGQFCIVMPQYDAVLVFTSGTREMGAVMDVAWEKLVPALREGVLPPAKEAQQRLQQTLSSLALAMPAAGPRPSGSAAWMGRRYVFPPAPPVTDVVVQPASAQPVEWLVLREPATSDPAGSTAFDARIDGRELSWVVSPGRWSNLAAVGKSAASVSGGWTAGDTYTLKFVYYRTPFTALYRLKFSAERLDVEVEQPLNPPPTRRQSFTATSAPR